jgi:hypothetical protein
MVDLVENDQHDAAATVEFLPQHRVDLTLAVAGFRDVVLRLAERVDEGDCDTVAGIEAIAVLVDGREREVRILVGILFESIQEIVRSGGFADACLAVEKDVVGLFSVDDRFERFVIFVEFVVATDEGFGRVVVEKCLPVLERSG